jgi:hypothetical protein
LSGISTSISAELYKNTKKIDNSVKNHIVVKDMGKKWRTKVPPAPAEKDIPDTDPKDADTGNSGFPPVVFSGILEFCIVFFCIAYSLFCLNAYLLNAVPLKLSVINLVFLLGAEFLLPGSIAYKKNQVIADIKQCLYGILVFLISFLISLHISPPLLPNSWSADYPHHDILIDFLSTHEQLPLLTSGWARWYNIPSGRLSSRLLWQKLSPCPL